MNLPAHPLRLLIIYIPEFCSSKRSIQYYIQLLSVVSYKTGMETDLFFNMPFHQNPVTYMAISFPTQLQQSEVSFDLDCDWMEVLSQCNVFLGRVDTEQKHI